MLGADSEFSFESINLDEVKEFEIKDSSGSLKFEKIKSNWFFKTNGDRALSVKIEKVLSKIKAIKRSRLIPDNEVLSSRLRIDDNNYNKKITLMSAKPLVLFFKKMDMDGKSYVRIKGQKKVFEVYFSLDDLIIDSKLWIDSESQQISSDSVLR